MRNLLLLCFAVLLGCQSAGVPPLPDWQSPRGLDEPELGEIRDLRSGETLSPEQLVERLAAAPRVLVGERHDNADHHALQLWLLRALAERRAQGSLLLEMLNPDQQARVERVEREGEPDDLMTALAWQNGWGWSLYGPLVRYALAQPYPLLAANLDRAEIMRIYRAAPPLSGAASNAEEVRQSLLEQLREAHCGMLPESQLPAMLAIQQQRDRRMAERLLAAPQPAMLLAGAYHVRRDLGVPLHLADLGADEALVLILAEVGKPVAADDADFVWYTAAVPEEDHCAPLRARSRER